MDNARVTLHPQSGITAEQAHDIRARAWRFVFDCYKRKKAAHPGGPDDAKEFKNARTATNDYTE
jgi:hypothetical protein